MLPLLPDRQREGPLAGYSGLDNMLQPHADCSRSEIFEDFAKSRQPETAKPDTHPMQPNPAGRMDRSAALAGTLAICDAVSIGGLG